MIMKNDAVKTIDPVPLGQWRMTGVLGESTDMMAKARLIESDVWDMIYPETEDAFRLREDDRSHPGRGVWRGEFWGKYILSAVAACRYYASPELEERIRQAVHGLLSTQDPDGYIGTYSDSAFHGENTWNIWCRKYTLWGLLEAWELLKDDSILEAASRFTDHLIQETGPAGQSMIRTGQFCGLPSTSILKPVLMLYRATGQQRYLDFGRYIVRQWSQHPSGIPDILNKGLQGEPIHLWFDDADAWAKSYEFISCAEGLLELYRLTGVKSYYNAVKNIHRAIIQWERSPVGSISFNDKFIGSRFLINTVGEICEAVYWNRLSLQLFMLSQHLDYIEEIERTAYNAMLCGMKPDGSWALRRLRLTHEHIPAHPHFLKHHQCCVDNLPRGLFQLAESSLFTDSDGIYVALYNSGSGMIDLPSGRTAQLRISEGLLEHGKVRISLDPAEPESFEVRLRMPAWSRSTSVWLNEEQLQTVQPGSWLKIRRNWQPGDQIDIQFDMSLRVEFFDPDMLDQGDPLIAWHVEQWAKMGFVSEDKVKMVFTQKSRLSKDDALPHRRAVMFFRGPQGLARDRRLGDPDLFAPLPPEFDPDSPGLLEPIQPPDGIRQAYQLHLGSGVQLKLCDFASAGNTWDEKSIFSAWILCNDV